MPGVGSGPTCACRPRLASAGHVPQCEPPEAARFRIFALVGDSMFLQTPSRSIRGSSSLGRALFGSASLFWQSLIVIASLLIALEWDGATWLAAPMGCAVNAQGSAMSDVITRRVLSICIAFAKSSVDRAARG